MLHVRDSGGEVDGLFQLGASKLNDWLGLTGWEASKMATVQKVELYLYSHASRSAQRKSSQDVNEEACRSRIGYCGLSFRAAGLAWQVSRLFKDHKELLAEFSHFLPDRLKLVSAAFPND